MLRLHSIAIVLLALLPAGLWAASGSQAPRWQEGEILSRKTILPGNHGNHTRYVYRIRSGGMQYTARFDQPLSVMPYASVKFSVSRKHLLVQDPNGTERKASILTRSEPVIRR